MRMSESQLRKTIQTVIRESVMSKADICMKNVIIQLHTSGGSAMNIKSELQSMSAEEIGVICNDNESDPDIAGVCQGQILDIIDSAESGPYELNYECPTMQFIIMQMEELGLQ